MNEQPPEKSIKEKLLGNTQPPITTSSIKEKLIGNTTPPASTGILDRIKQKLGIAPREVIDTPQYHTEETSGLLGNSFTYTKKDNLNQTFKPTYAKDNLAEKTAYSMLMVESGGKQVKGASGEFGLFQFMPATWAGISKKMYGTVLPQTAENEWKLAVVKVTELLKSYTPREIALIWNTSLGGAEKPFVRKGVNSKGVKYDSGAHADKVAAVLASLK